MSCKAHWDVNAYHGNKALGLQKQSTKLQIMSSIPHWKSAVVDNCVSREGASTNESLQLTEHSRGIKSNILASFWQSKTDLAKTQFPRRR